MRVFVLTKNYEGVDGDGGLAPVRREERGRFVVVFLSHTTTDELKNLRCVSCGWVVAQYSGDVVSMFYGADSPLDASKLDVRCGRCHLTYRIV